MNLSAVNLSAVNLSAVKLSAGKLSAVKLVPCEVGASEKERCDASQRFGVGPRLTAVGGASRGVPEHHPIRA